MPCWTVNDSETMERLIKLKTSTGRNKLLLLTATDELLYNKNSMFFSCGAV